MCAVVCFKMVFFGLIVVFLIILIVKISVKWILPNAIATKLSNKLNAEVTIGQLAIHWNFLRLWKFSLTIVIYDVNITYYVEEETMSNILDNNNIFDLNIIMVIKDFFNFTKFQAIQINNLSVLISKETNIDSAQFGKFMCLYVCANELHFNRPKIENFNNLLLNIDVMHTGVKCFESYIKLNIMEAKHRKSDMLAEIDFDLKLDATLILEDRVLFQKFKICLRDTNICVTKDFYKLTKKLLLSYKHKNILNRTSTNNDENIFDKSYASLLPKEFEMRVNKTSFKDGNLSMTLGSILFSYRMSDNTFLYYKPVLEIFQFAVCKCDKKLVNLQEIKFDIKNLFNVTNINFTLKTLHFDYNHESIIKWLSRYSSKTSKITNTVSTQKRFLILNNFKKLLKTNAINITAGAQNISGQINFKKKEKIYTSSLAFNSMHIESSLFSEQVINAKLDIKQFGWCFNKPAWELPNWDDMHVFDRPFCINSAQFKYDWNKNGRKITIIGTSLVIELTNILAEHLSAGINAFNNYWSTNGFDNSQQDNQIMVEISLFKANCFIKLLEYEMKYLLLSCDRIDSTMRISKESELQHSSNYEIKMYESKLVPIQNSSICYKFSKLADIKDYKIYSDIVHINICNKEQERCVNINLINYTHVQCCPKTDIKLFNLSPDTVKCINTLKHLTQQNAKFLLNINGKCDFQIAVSKKYYITLAFDEAARKYIVKMLDIYLNQTMPLSNLRYMLFGKNSGVRLIFEKVRFTYICIFVELCTPLPVKNKEGFIVAFDDLLTDHSGVFTAFKLLNFTFSPSKETWTEFWDGGVMFLKNLFTPKAIQQ